MIVKHFPRLPTRFKMTSPKNVNKTVLCYGSPVWSLKTYLLNCFQHMQKFIEWSNFYIK